MIHLLLALSFNGLKLILSFFYFLFLLIKHAAPSDKLEALILAESMVTLKGEGWLISRTNLSDVQDCVPPER